MEIMGFSFGLYLYRQRIGEKTRNTSMPQMVFEHKTPESSR